MSNASSFVQLGNVITHIRTGLNPRKNFKLNDAGAEHWYITVRELNGNTVVPSPRTDKVNSAGLALIQKRANLQIDDILFSGVGTVGKTAIINAETVNWGLKEGIFALTIDRDLALPKYVLYWLNSFQFANWLGNSTDLGSLSSISMASFKRAPVPLPPLEIQERIVDTLDSFTGIINSLNSEIALRKQQFEHMLFEIYSQTSAPQELLAQHGEVIKGKGIAKANLLDRGIPAIHYGQIHTKYGHSATQTVSFIAPDLIAKPSLASFGDIILATTSEDDEAVAKATAWLGKEDVVVGGDAHIYKHDLEPRYVSYFFASHNFLIQKLPKLTGAKVRRINAKALESIEIPVPPMDEQVRIADELDTLDAYIRGIEQEIELREQQLNYYREQLLTFPTAKTTTQ